MKKVRLTFIILTILFGFLFGSCDDPYKETDEVNNLNKNKPIKLSIDKDDVIPPKDVGSN